MWDRIRDARLFIGFLVMHPRDRAKIVDAIKAKPVTITIYSSGPEEE